MTSAPRSPRTIVQNGPGALAVRSRQRMPSSGPGTELLLTGRDRLCLRGEPELLGRDLPHAVLLDLPGDRHGERVDELPVARNLERRDAAATGRVEISLGKVGSLLELDPGHDLLAVALAGDADHVGLAHALDGQEKFLELARID